MSPLASVGPGGPVSPLEPFKKSIHPFPPNPGSPLKSIENASADCLYATEINPVNSAIVNNIVIDDLLLEFINVVY